MLNSRNALWVKVRVGEVRPISAKETEIKVSPRFNVREKRHRLTTLSRDLDGAVSMLQTGVTRPRQAATPQGHAGECARPDGDPIVNAIRAAETRNVLRTMPEGERVRCTFASRRARERGHCALVCQRRCLCFQRRLDRRLACLPSELFVRDVGSRNRMPAMVRACVIPA